jgi:hypothetical protein
MFDYRVYPVDHEGHAVAPPHIFLCEDDQAAMAEARKYVDGRAVEVWRGGDRVGAIPPDDLQ